MQKLNTKKYLLTESVESIIDTLIEDCKPFLKETKGDFILYRGAETDKKIDGIAKKVVRTDRKPRNMPLTVTVWLNELFKKKFGHDLRTTSVFVTPDKWMTLTYGKSYRFFPIGKYSYYWSPSIGDLYVYLRSEKSHPYFEALTNKIFIPKYMSTLGYSKIKDQKGYEKQLTIEVDKMREGFLKFLKETIDTYVDNNILNNANKEMMFVCKSYYLVNTKEYPTFDFILKRTVSSKKL